MGLTGNKLLIITRLNTHVPHEAPCVKPNQKHQSLLLHCSELVLKYFVKRSRGIKPRAIVGASPTILLCRCWCLTNNINLSPPPLAS